MTTSDPFKPLRDHRAALLACEAIGWLHMAGKAHPDFVKQQASDATKGATTWTELTWATNVFGRFGTLPSIGTQAITPKELFEKHREARGTNGVLDLLQERRRDGRFAWPPHSSRGPTSLCSPSQSGRSTAGGSRSSRGHAPA